MTRLLRPLLAAAFALALAPAAFAGTATIAVATNFAGAAEALAAGYKAASGQDIAVTAGATGKLYAQVAAGAPFDAFLSADLTTIRKLAEAGLGEADTSFTYATGSLLLWSADAGADLSDPARALRAATHVALANPDLAPYGKAAVETIETLGLTEAIKDKIVTGENIGQAYTMVASGAAELGFVAASSVIANGRKGAFREVPAGAHAPIAQGAILLARGSDNPAAIGFLDYLKSPEAIATIESFGYRAGD
ncbi:MAG: molybdate ABC transporter substrate-binding protein [Paracoccaceae bacterium]